MSSSAATKRKPSVETAPHGSIAAQNALQSNFNADDTSSIDEDERYLVSAG